MTTRNALFACVLVLLGILIFGTFARSESQPAQGNNPFAGKYLSLVRKSDTAYRMDLEKVVVQPFGDRLFLVGIGSDTPDNWQRGLLIWIALDDIAEISVFPTLDELRKVYAALRTNS
jgi:hypothetical protein